VGLPTALYSILCELRGCGQDADAVAPSELLAEVAASLVAASLVTASLVAEALAALASSLAPASDAPPDAVVSPEVALGAGSGAAGGSAVVVWSELDGAGELGAGATGAATGAAAESVEVVGGGGVLVGAGAGGGVGGGAGGLLEVTLASVV
jgi:hypothetical protein